MEKKYTLTLDKEFTQYCELNNITDIQKQAKETFSRGFALLKYGEVPQGNRIKEIVEVVKEVVNMDEINRLTEENKKLKSDLDKITTSINNMSRGGRFIKNSNLGSLYDE